MSRRKQGDFGKWHSKWLKSHVAESSQTSINEWFMGKCDGLVANKTHKVTKADLESTPYRTFYKYKAEIVKTSSVMSTNGPSSTNPTTNPDDESPSENWDFWQWTKLSGLWYTTHDWPVMCRPFWAFKVAFDLSKCARHYYITFICVLFPCLFFKKNKVFWTQRQIVSSRKITQDLK